MISATAGRTDPSRARRREAGPTILAALLVVECGIFSALGTNFLTVRNGFEVLRLTIEIGLLALAVTPVILSGGIDLSVGSLLGLSAVLFGLAWRDLGLPIVAAGALALGVGAAGGLLNGLLVTRLKIPPLIATLGSFSMFRGLAEGLTEGTDNVTGFPAWFLSLGQGYVLGAIPTALPILVVAAVGVHILVHRSVVGRALSAIGYSPEGARHAGLPVAGRTLLVYALSGLLSSVAALVYVAHLGQAKADAGLGYELKAITAVVLGGTSIFGGRGSVPGTVLGLLVISVLQVGLRLSDLPAELAGVLTGVLLIVAIGLDRRPGPAWTVPMARDNEGGSDVRNSQVAVVCGVVLAAAMMVAGSNIYLARSLVGDRPGPRPGAAAPAADAPRPRARPITIAMMPKSKGNAYFRSCQRGADEAAAELGVTLVWDGPTDPDPARQVEIIDTWITRGVDAIAVAVENRAGISSVLRKARAAGIKVVTWDSDADPDSRDFFVNQATPEGIGRALMDAGAKSLGGKGSFAIITASLTAANMIEWQRQIEIRRKEAYPDIRLAALRPCDDIQKKAFDEATAVMNADRSVGLLMAICSPGVPGAAEAVKQSGRSDVKVVGLGLPNDNKRFVRDGITEAVILWDTRDLGYLAVLAARDLVAGTLRPAMPSISAGRLGPITIRGDNILLGTPVTFTRENSDKYDV